MSLLRVVSICTILLLLGSGCAGRKDSSAVIEVLEVSPAPGTPLRADSELDVRIRYRIEPYRRDQHYYVGFAFERRKNLDMGFPRTTSLPSPDRRLVEATGEVALRETLARVFAWRRDYPTDVAVPLRIRVIMTEKDRLGSPDGSVLAETEQWVFPIE